MPDELVVYVRLLDEGTDAWRPVNATLISEGVYRLSTTQEPEERWEFGPGSFVRCARHVFSDGTSGLAAVSRADHNR